MIDLPDLPDVKGEWLEELIFLGTGTSAQVPSIDCITSSLKQCKTCTDAMNTGSPNRRGCTSAVVVGAPRDRPQERSTILIDCGKSFYSSAIEQFPKYGLRRIDAVLLTHGHADAILGLDDLRSWTMQGCVQNHVDIYLTQECMQTVQGTFPYLVDTRLVTGGGDVGTLRWHIINAQSPFSVGRHNISVTPLPVEHGFIGPERRPFECLGFRIDSLSYVSDCHRIPPATYDRMAGSQVVVLDALNMYRHPSHFSIPQAITAMLKLAVRPNPPVLALFVDMTHRIEYRTTEAQLQKLIEALRTFRTTLPADVPENWWAEIWDADANEKFSELHLRHDNAKVSCTPYPAREVPGMHLAIDGQRIKFGQ
ncbi:hypothetical protein MYAM1_001164 [Malassezia yamatoensis]|uniref:Metallo-beta-lactamase domain-containing protein n=1 Tax=Malassezia yamatoensis TaxID=253288 RepID=A0AAJ5YVL4_9BASI|nr:hypothetical protein MYAM1_001164 [Malassezia yamatoensis]